MGKQKTRLQQLEERNRIIYELDVYRVLEDESEINQLLVKLKMLDEMIQLAKRK